MAAKKDEKVEPKPVVAEETVADAPEAEEKADKADVEAQAEAQVLEGNPVDVKVDENPTKAEDANTVLVQAIRSFEGIEGDKGPRSEPFRVSRQRYADLKANDLVELVDEKAGSDPH